MAGRKSYRIAYQRDGKTYRLTRVTYGSDGSYYVAAPVHPDQRALLAKFTVNYAQNLVVHRIDDAVDLGTAAADDKEIKLTHHPDGFMQFSGAGLVSGRDENGEIRGIGVDTWTLYEPNRGPAFGIAITDIEGLGVESTASKDTILFSDSDVVPLQEADVVVLEGYYFPPLWRRFIRPNQQGEPVIEMVHPSRAVLQLRVALPPPSTELPGFLGLEVYTNYGKGPDDEPRPGFFMSGSTGNIRENDAGEILADGIHCMYPAEDLEVVGRTLDYVPDYLMREIPPDGRARTSGDPAVPESSEDQSDRSG